MDDWHISRKWFGSDADMAGCICTILPCGFVSAGADNVNECPQHGFDSGKTLRRMHTDQECPGEMGLIEGDANANPE